MDAGFRMSDDDEFRLIILLRILLVMQISLSLRQVSSWQNWVVVVDSRNFFTPINKIEWKLRVYHNTQVLTGSCWVYDTFQIERTLRSKKKKLEGVVHPD